MPAHIRLATIADAAEVQAIYAPYVRDTVISFEAEPPTVDEMRRRMSKVLEKWPWLVCEQDGQIIGYAYASDHHERAAYQWSVDAAVYVRQGFHRSGVGRALYQVLFPLLKLQGFFNAYAGIALPNAGSVGLHESVGFRHLATYQAVGYKMGAWLDVGWWHLLLQEKMTDPSPLIPLKEIQNHPEWKRIMDAASSISLR